MARGGAAVRVRARRAPALGALGRAPLPRHPPGRGPRRGAERDGECAPAPSAARHLRAPRGWRDLRPARRLRRAAAARGRAGLLGVLLGAGRARAVGGGRAGARRGRAPAARARRGAGAAARSARRRQAVILRARGVARRFGRDLALAPTDLVVAAGEVVALVGPNGAGKSTLLALLAGALEPSEGTVERADGVRIGWAPQRPAFYGRLTPRENLELFARLEGEAEPAAAAARLLGAFELPDRGRSSGDLSVGNRQRLNLAIALLGSPRVLLLDEPTAALDPTQRERLWERVAAVRDLGGAVVFATQNLEELADHADRVVKLDDGRLVFDGAPAEAVLA
ncbi:MAG: ABC transporter ATP-binding protein [Actinobacteria bacterium]|nr:MAG: ABC transporter ATP-binding protein [Actinomycetota bacterium]